MTDEKRIFILEKSLIVFAVLATVFLIAGGFLWFKASRVNNTAIKAEVQKLRDELDEKRRIAESNQSQSLVPDGGISVSELPLKAESFQRAANILRQYKSMLELDIRVEKDVSVVPTGGIAPDRYKVTVSNYTEMREVLSLAKALTKVAQVVGFSYGAPAMSTGVSGGSNPLETFNTEAVAPEENLSLENLSPPVYLILEFYGR